MPLLLYRNENIRTYTPSSYLTPRVGLVFCACHNKNIKGLTVSVGPFFVIRQAAESGPTDFTHK